MAGDSSSLLAAWLSEDRYFDDLAVFGLGPLHPGGMAATKDLLSCRIWDALTVLDIGCGNGATMRALAQQGANVLGVEPSRFMREAARQMGTDPSRVIPQSLQALNLSQTFDVIILEGVIGFVCEAAKQLSRLITMMSPCGELLVSDWEPHDRPSFPKYDFVVRSATSSKVLAATLTTTGVHCTVMRRTTVARAFAMDVEEAWRRAALFFPDAEACELMEAVRRKVHYMRRALPSDVPCRRYLLRAKAAA